jgi:hypothetical protein
MIEKSGVMGSGARHFDRGFAAGALVLALFGCGGSKLGGAGGQDAASGTTGAGGSGGGAGMGGNDAGSVDGGGVDAGSMDVGGMDVGGMDAGADAIATDGPCPPPAQVIIGSTDLCSTCPGVACAPDDRCSSTFHASGGPHGDSCSCFEGHMGCCTSSLDTNLTSLSCSYGGFPSPPCPTTEPTKGAPCGPGSVSCDFADPCCAGGRATAVCSGVSSWGLICSPPQQGVDCSAVAAGTRCDQGADGGTSACRCDSTDGGGRAWTCGPGI